MELVEIVEQFLVLFNIWTSFLYIKEYGFASTISTISTGGSSQAVNGPRESLSPDMRQRFSAVR